MITKVTIQTCKGPDDVLGQSIYHEIKRTLGITTIDQVRTSKVYRLQGFSPETTDYFARTVLIDPLHETYTINATNVSHAVQKIEVAKKPGVMNPEVATLFSSSYRIKNFRIACC